MSPALVPVPAPVPTLAGHQTLLFLLQLGVLLLIALCLGRLAQRCGLPSIVGELLTGILLGPSMLGWAAPDLVGRLTPSSPEQAHLLDAVALLSVVLLVGVSGAHLDVGLVRRRAATVARVSMGALLLPLALGVTTGALVPGVLVGGETDRVTFAVFLGVAMSVSAIPVIAKTLMDMKLLHRDIGQLALASATINDVVAWFVLSLVSAMAGAGLSAGHLATSSLFLVAFLVLAVLLGRLLIPRVMGWAARTGDAGTTSATAVVIVLLGAAAGHALRLEAVFGAFVAGVLIGSRRTVEPALLAPLRTVVLSVLAPIFLASAGLRVDLTALADPAVLLSGLVILLLAVLAKFLGSYMGARLSRMSRAEGVALGAALNSRGAVEVVMAMVGLRLGVLNQATYTIVVLVAVLTSIMAPPLLRWAMNRVESTAAERFREEELSGWHGDGAIAGRRGE
ncbi:cation:proton antiporter [Sphaerimonospora sp. CA-214678]|uniref:cation:proton antiporter n=1 Tax=Sphaerimonospora sp. CA-214678 TaxID=3240029 RepID=UPI003D8ADC93